MAYDLSGSGQYWQGAGAAVTAAPLTMACWFNPDTVTAGYVLMALGRTGTANHYFYLESSGTVAGDPVVFGGRAGVGVPYASINGITANAWQHACGVTSGISSRFVFLNGVKSAENTGSVTPSSLNTTDIGMVTSNTPVAPLNGKIAEVGIWNAALTDEEVAALAKGVSPAKVRPQSLVFYAPLIREVLDVKGGRALTQTGSPAVFPHPRIYY